MQLNKSTVYAINIMIHLAKNQCVISSAELSRSLAISKRYLLKIAAKLRDSKMVGVSFGPVGGYSLRKAPMEISVYDIVMLMEGNIISPYNVRDGPDTELCFQDAMNFLKTYVETYLRSMTLDKLTNRGANDWAAEITTLVESHIDSLLQYV